MTPTELADYLDQNVEAMFACEQVHIDEAAAMLRQQHTDLEHMWMANTVLEAEIKALKERLEDCSCQGGHSEAWLKAKGRLK